MITKQSNLRIFLLISILLHCAILFFSFFFTPSHKIHKPSSETQETIISFSPLPVSEKTNVKTQKKQVEKPTDNISDAKKSKQVLTPEQNHLPKPKPEEVVLPNPEEVAPPKPEEIKKKELPKPKVQEKNNTKKPIKDKDTKVKKKPIESKATQELDALLRNLDKNSAGKNLKSRKMQNVESTDAIEEILGTEDVDKNKNLSISEIDAIKQALNTHWYPPANSNLYANLQAVFDISFNIDGSIENVLLTSSKTCNNNVDQFLCQSFIDSAHRAIYAASPLTTLPKERYNNWKSITFKFSPKGIL